MAEFPPGNERVGCWNFKVGVDTHQWQLDTERFIRETRDRMVAIEENITRRLVVAKLREMGYTVIEPEEES